MLLACWLGVTLWGDPVAYNAAPVHFIFLGTPLILAAGLAAWHHGYRAARFFVLATMVSLTGALCTALTVSGFLPYTFATFHAAEFGILVDVVLLSLALGIEGSPLFHSPWWLGFTAFVGVNLLQSGLTKWCLMESILRKLGMRAGA